MNATISLQAPPETEQAPALQQAHAPVVATPQRETRSDRWMITALIVCSCLFAGALGWYVLNPAIDTVAGTSAENWTQAP